jgi:hypothetical protein
MALSQRDYRQQRIEKLEREIDELRDKYWLEPPGENRRRIIAARDAKLAEVDELKRLNERPSVLEKTAVTKVAYAVAIVFMVYGLLAQDYSTFTFGVFALLVGLLGSYQRDQK